jgi:MoaA/NifB/PqqE/SkfB family radical SAM enzyme
VAPTSSPVPAATAAALPKIMNLAYDRGCNLACAYCRTELFYPKKDVNNVGAVHRNLFAHGLEGVERLVIAGNGDVCASRYYMDFLENFDADRYPGLRIKIQTNGLLFTRDRWQRIAKSHSAIDWISVSVDAATPETYRINRGGDFRKLRECLQLVSEIRKAGTIELFFINFVVQANNFREMKAFVDLGEEFGCDLVEFQCIENWGTFSPEQFDAVAVQQRTHPDHQAFLDHLNDPRFANPIVSLYKLLEFLPEYIRKWIGQEQSMSYHTVGEAIGQRDIVRQRSSPE